MVEAHFFSLDVDAVRLRELEGVLTWEERTRATRFRFDRDRNRFIACRGKLRELLGLNPRQELVCGPFGKPSLGDSEIRFNVSHSHGMAMIAITRGREVGCDIERINPSFADENIPERFFSPHEVAALRALPAEEQCEAFFRCWTRKEAFIKACGMGMSLALDSFDVTLTADRARLLRGGEGWSLHNADAPEGYAAAIVLEDTQAEACATNPDEDGQIAAGCKVAQTSVCVHPAITMPTSSLISSITKSGGAAANVSG